MHQILAIFIANSDEKKGDKNFAEIQLDFDGISQITQKMLQNPEDLKKTANNKKIKTKIRQKFHSWTKNPV